VSGFTDRPLLPHSLVSNRCARPVINAVLGTTMRVISGYPGGTDISLAMERGEVQGRCGWSWSSLKSTHGHWVKDKKVTLLAQLGLSKHADLPNVPSIMDFARTSEDKAMLRLIFARQGLGRPFLAPPGIPAERLVALRKAFDATMKDADFLADADKGKMEINPLTGRLRSEEALEKQAAALMERARAMKSKRPSDGQPQQVQPPFKILRRQAHTKLLLKCS
jgi:tripartite-type tricarboxylate transporter receptor subunit TctC